MTAPTRRPRFALLLTTLALLSAVAHAGGRIALTFDDAPRQDGHLYTGQQRTRRLVEQLKAANVSQAAFFCNTVRFDDAGRDRILAYAKAGHLVANHTHSHPDLREVGPAAFVPDIEKAHRLLKGFPGFTPLFRFPYLREGKTKEDRDAVRKALSELGYRNGYVTVDNYDWHMDRVVQDALARGRRVDFSKLRETYLRVLWQGIQFYDELAVKTLGRSPNHVLLLHENDLAALFVADLVAFLEARDWKVIAVDEAYRDPIALVEPDTLVLGQGRVMGIAAANGHPGPFASPWENERVIEALFDEAGIFDGAPPPRR